MDLDVILQDLGQFGRYQVFSYAILFFPVLFSAFPALSFVFTTSHLNYRCAVPECENNLEPRTFNPPWLHNAVPFSNGRPEYCERYKPILHDNITSCLSSSFMTNVTQKCDEYVFEDSSTSIVLDFDMICYGNDWKRTSIGSINNLGLFIGLPIGGFISDRFGRKIMIVTVSVLSAVMGVLKSFSTNYIMFATLEFFDSLIGGNIYMGCFVLGLEIVSPNKRMFGTMLLSCFFSLGEALLGCVMWYFKDWRLMLRIIYTPGFLFIIYAWILPESIRWLDIKGYNKKAAKIVKKIAKVNRNQISDNVAHNLEMWSSKGEVIVNKENYKQNRIETTYKPVVQEASTFSKIMKSKILLLRLANCSFCWMTNTFIYYGLSLNAVSVGGNPYLNFILVSLVEIPAFFCSTLVSDWLGRRFSLCGSLIAAGVTCLSFYFIDADMLVLRMVFLMIGKLAITISFTVLYLFTAEMFPTELRHSLLSTCSMFGRIGSMIAPQTSLLAIFIEPLTLLGLVSLIGGGLSLSFPETLNVKLPDTIEEAENIGATEES